MGSAIILNSRQGCGATNLALFLTTKPSDGYLSNRSLLKGVFTEFIVKWLITTRLLTG